MRALVIPQPGTAIVDEVPAPRAAPGEAVVDVRRVGVCGTDAQFFAGTMPLLATGDASYPMRIGHEWAGVVSAVGEGVSPDLIGTRVTGDTMLGCGHCGRCADGRQHMCADRFELGVRGGRPGALAEQVAVPASSLHHLPDTVDDAAGAMVEPGSLAVRAVRAAGLRPGESVLVMGAATIGMLTALFARADGAEVHLLGRSAASLDFARSLGLDNVWSAESLPEGRWDAVIDASNGPAMPGRAIDLVEPGRTVVYIGLAGEASHIDTRDLVFNDVTARGLLSGSPTFGAAIEAYAAGTVDPRPLIAAAVPLAEMPSILAGERPADAGPGPKIHAIIDTAR